MRFIRQVLEKAKFFEKLKVPKNNHQTVFLEFQYAVIALSKAPQSLVRIRTITTR